MKGIRVGELKKMSVPELLEMVEKERASLYKARKDVVLRQMQDTASLRVRRKNLARILTIIAEKKRGSIA